MNDLEKVKQQFGARIRSIRTSKKLTQEKLAEKVDMNTVYLSNIERGKENPTLHLLIRVAAALGVELWELFDYKHEVNAKQLKDSLKKFTNEIDNEEKMRTAVRVLRAIFY